MRYFNILDLKDLIHTFSLLFIIIVVVVYYYCCCCFCFTVYSRVWIVMVRLHIGYKLQVTYKQLSLGVW